MHHLDADTAEATEGERRRRRGAHRVATNPNMAVETVQYDTTSARVRATGELDIGTAAPLWAVLQGHHLAGRRFLRLDMSEVTFLDAAALGGIVDTHEKLLRDRGTLVLTGVRRPVARVLRMTGLDEVLLVGGLRADGDAFGGELELAGR